MGKKDSSLTRVQPMFKQLLEREDSNWFSKLLELSKQDYAKQIAKNPGDFLQTCKEKPFEVSLAPPAKFLRWLIQNPDKMSWPRNKKYSNNKENQKKREALKRGEEAVIHEAMRELEKNGPENSGQQWWAFEGFTSVDCLLETEKISIAIEGKRTEAGQSKSVSWYSHRDQLIRNIEALQQKAGDKDYGVFLVDEKGNNPFTDDDFVKSLPHLSESERQEIKNHFLGAVSWNKLIDKTGFDGTLPDTVDDVS